MTLTRSSVIRKCESGFPSMSCHGRRPPDRGYRVLRPAARAACVTFGLAIGLSMSAPADEPTRGTQAPPPAEQPARSASGPLTPIQAYQAVCLRCHDPDGRGARLRRIMPELPDFTNAKWQDLRTDRDLDHTIRVGTGKWMRPMTHRLGSVEVKEMVAYVRAFRDGRQLTSNDRGPQPRPVPPKGRATLPPDRR
jgi:mono/diheme cytochrome c family protein